LGLSLDSMTDLGADLGADARHHVHAQRDTDQDQDDALS
jgi:hypothetical protein